MLRKGCSKRRNRKKRTKLPLIAEREKKTYLAEHADKKRQDKKKKTENGQNETEGER